MERRVRLTESELTRIILRVISEQQVSSPNYKGDGDVQVSSPNYRGDGGIQVSAGQGPRPTTGQGPRPTTGQGPRPTTGQGPRPTTGQNRPMGPIKKITPVIEIDCNRKVILSSQLPKLDKNANYVIINHYCNKQ